jgi:hypothetical protein
MNKIFFQFITAFCLVFGWSTAALSAEDAASNSAAQSAESPQAKQLKLVIKSHANANSIEEQREFAADLYAYGDALDERFYPDEIIAFYDELVKRFDNSTDEYILDNVAYAKFGKGIILGNHQRDDQAIIVLDAFINQFGSKGDRYINLICGAFNAKGHFLADNNYKFDLGLASYYETVKRCGSYPDIAENENTHLQVVEALKQTSDIQVKQEKQKEAANSLDEIAKRYANSTSEVLKSKAEDAAYRRDRILKPTQISN